MKCRHCRSELSFKFLDLGTSPPSNAYLKHEQLNSPEVYFPLRLFVCQTCWLAQTEDFTGRDLLFNKDYAYFSSFSTSWLSHAKDYVDEMVQRFGLTSDNCVVEIASNDGYLLQYVKDKGIRCLGIEPTKSTAAAAREKGIETLEVFFGLKAAEELVTLGCQADLMVANNVLAHVPDINDFVSGFATLLKPKGVATFEFPHLLEMVKHNQFDTAYHEHYSYLSFTAIIEIFEANGLSVFDVSQLPTHGGSLRVFAQRREIGHHPIDQNVGWLLNLEAKAGIKTAEFYKGFQKKAEDVKSQFLAFLLEAKASGKTVAAYGAAAKGNTLLNFAGIRDDLLSFVVDRNPVKQGQYMPGSRIIIVDEAMLVRERPEFVVILPWNLRSEIMSQLSYISEWNSQFVTAIPELMITKA